MFTHITLTLAKLGELFSSNTYKNSLERYIESQHPTNAAEVDYYIREYDRLTRRGGSYL